MDSYVFLLFLVDELKQFDSAADPTTKGLLIESGTILIRMITTFREGGRRVELSTLQDDTGQLMRHLPSNL